MRVLTEQEIEEKERALRFWGSGPEIDDLILNILSALPNRRNGVTFAQLENYFYRREIAVSNRALCKHLESLQKHKIVCFDVCRGLKFYKVTE